MGSYAVRSTLKILWCGSKTAGRFDLGILLVGFSLREVFKSCGC